MMAYDQRVDHVPVVRAALTDVHMVCDSLGLSQGAKRNGARGLIVCCPAHGEKNASCSVTLGPDGTIRVKCFGCQMGGDVLTLIAAARGIDVVRNFREVLEEAAEIGGLWDVLDEIRGGELRPRPTAPPPRAKPLPAPDARAYPPAAEVARLWASSTPAGQDSQVSAWLRSRALDSATVTERDLARALPFGDLPAWARYQGATWAETGHRLLLPVFDARGRMISVRAGRVIDGDTPKRLPPAGHLAAGLVLANPAALAMFGHGARVELLVVEGEPDYLTWASRPDQSALAVVGMGSGWWTKAHAARVPARSRVIVRTHQDAAGDKYAEEVARSLVRRCDVARPPRGQVGDENDALRAAGLPAEHDAGAVPMVVDSVDPRSFLLGRLFSEYCWLGDEIRPGVFMARCPSEALHVGGERFDGRTIVRRSPEDPDGVFRCPERSCRAIYGSSAAVVEAMGRVASSEGPL